MFDHWIYKVGAKACAWSSAVAKPVLPQFPCNVEESRSMGVIVLVNFALIALYAVYRDVDRLHGYFRRDRR